MIPRTQLTTMTPDHTDDDHNHEDADHDDEDDDVVQDDDADDDDEEDGDGHDGVDDDDAYDNDFLERCDCLITYGSRAIVASIIMMIDSIINDINVSV